jgi:hypothetical protein
VALLPNPTGPALGGSGGRSTGGVFVTFENLDRVNAILAEVEDSLKKTASGEMRAGAKDIANQIVIPQLKRAARSSPIRMSRALAETARAKSDRVVMVQIGGVNPPLEGFRRGVGEGRAQGKKTSTGRVSTSRTWRTTLAWGSELGPWPGGRAPRADGSRGAPVNHYRAARNESGYWVQPGTQNAIPAAHKAYAVLIESIITKYSRFR